jgi:hypothetical protein
MKCNLCPLDAIIFLRDLKAKKKPTLYLCEAHFKAFCFGLIKKGIKYENRTTGKSKPS